MKTEKKDILIFMSDQHGYFCMGHNSNYVRTPNLDRIASEGAEFTKAYTSCPLCVPARCSFLSSLYPARTGILTNDEGLPEDIPTFLHSMALNGYDTVLCGRMHFVGMDQRHGFTKRIAPEITDLYWGCKEERRKEMGIYDGTTAEKGCLRLAGSGTSPVEEYDNMVIEKALKYLEEEHERPQLILIGTYAPHFPYVASKELYDYYMSILSEPIIDDFEFPLLEYKMQYTDPKHLKKIQAAYYAMVERMDGHIGRIHDAWAEYLGKSGRKGLFIYLSDHGDSLGSKNLFGKRNFFEPAEHIPMIFLGDGIEARKISTAVSIMDIGPTLIDMTGASELPDSDGTSLKNLLEENCEEERIVQSQLADIDDEGRFIYGKMATDGHCKLISYQCEDSISELLFDLDADPGEKVSCTADPAEYRKLKQSLYDDDYSRMKKEFLLRKERHALLTEWGISAKPTIPDERWHVPDTIGQGLDYIS